MNAHKDCGQNYFAPLLDCDCQVCKDAREAHDAKIRNATLDAVCGDCKLLVDDIDILDCKKCIVDNLRTQQEQP